jgi:hypothetical protein
MSDIPKDSDSRLALDTVRISDASGKFERAYCFLCGRPAGWVSKDSSNLISPEHIVVTCDQCDHDIIAKYGDLPFEKVPTELFDAFGYKPEKGGPPCSGTTPRLSNPPLPSPGPKST